MFLAWCWDSKLDGSGKIVKIVIYDKARVISGTNYEPLLGSQAGIIYLPIKALSDH